MIGLEETQRTKLRQASAKYIQDTFGRLDSHFANSEWLATNNLYLTDCIQALVDHTQPGGKIKGDDLSEYIAVSAILHCADGWSLIGRAIDAHASCDSSTTIHLAYYAELRAAMALLAAEGIGVFDNRHFIVTESGKCKQFIKKSGTHKIAWLALEYWSGLESSSLLLRQTIQPGGIPLGEWLDAFGAGTASRSIGRKWLKTWGLDLKRLSEGKDRNARNHSSYRPTRLNKGVSLNAIESSTFVRHLWALCEPSNSSRFDSLDRHLLRLSLELAYNAAPMLDTFKDKISNMLNYVMPTSPLIDQWRDFLIRATQPDDAMLIIDASGTASLGQIRHHLQVLSRAFLLLRVASGACAQLLQNVFPKKAKLEFWWKSLGEERGLWPSGDEPSDLTELWSDIDEALVDLREWENTNQSLPPSFHKWHFDLSYQISVLAKCERIALWGLGL